MKNFFDSWRLFLLDSQVCFLRNRFCSGGKTSEIPGSGFVKDLPKDEEKNLEILKDSNGFYFYSFPTGLLCQKEEANFDIIEQWPATSRQPTVHFHFRYRRRWWVWRVRGWQQ